MSDSNTTACTRSAAARLLRDARQASGDHRGEMAGWAYLAMPDRISARVLYVRALIAEDHLDEAKALVAQALLQHPTNKTLTFLRARILFLQNSFEQAERELRLLVPSRPTHATTLALAACIATALGNHDEASHYYSKALMHRPDRNDLHLPLVEAMLQTGDVSGAEQVMHKLGLESDLLEAQLLRARGQVLDAVDRVEHALTSASDDQHQTLLVDLIDHAEALRDSDRLRGAVQRVKRTQPAARIRAAAALLGLGEFRQAAQQVAGLIHGRHRHDALAVLVVSAVLEGRPNLARRAQTRLGRSASPVLMARLWRSGLTGRLFKSQASSKIAGADPSTSLLVPMLERAVQVFDQTTRHAPELPKSERAEIRRHQAACASILGAVDSSSA